MKQIIQKSLSLKFKLQGEIASTGKNYEIPNVQLLKIRSDKILLLRDYFPGEILKMAFRNLYI
jgi:hypothetical protein